SCALVTGTSSGIGRHAALELAYQGFLVFATIRSPKDGKSLLAEYENHNPGVISIIPIELDVTSSPSLLDEQRRVIVDKCKSAKRELTVLVNNAGVVDLAPIELADLPSVRHTFEVNFFGLLKLIQAFVPEIRDGVANLRSRQTSRGGNPSSTNFGGRIVNVGSVAGFSTPPFYGIYAASKHAVEAVSDALRNEISDDIFVSLVQPGAVLTEIEKKMSDQLEDRVEQLGVGGKVAKTYATRMRQFTLGLSKAMETDFTRRVSFSTTEHTTRAILDAIKSKLPRTRYLVGVDAKLIFTLKCLLPDRVLDYILRKFL
ncbi:hypothetical protein ScalyP_jg9170, partial [Parmales sp. scaly parma]